MAIPLPPPFPNRSDNPPNFNDLAEGYFAWLDNEAVPGINGSVSSVNGAVSSVNGMIAAAEESASQANASRNEANLARDQSEAYRDDAAMSAATAESVSGPTYPDTAAGLAATTDGQSFAVSNNDGTVTVWLNDGGAAVAQRTLATTAALAAASGATLIGLPGGGKLDQAVSYITPEQAGITHDPTLTTDQADLVQAWFDSCVAQGRAPFAPRPITVRIDSAVTYDPTASSRPCRHINLANLTLRPNFDGGLKIGNVAVQMWHQEIRLPSVHRSTGYASWAAHNLESRLSNKVGIIIYNSVHGAFHLKHVAGFTNGVAYHSENFGFAYNVIYGGWLIDNRYNEVGRNVRGTVAPGAEFFNENTFVGGRRGQSSTSNASGDAFGTVITSGENAYRGSNKNLWKSPTYEMGSPATATYRVPVLLDGCGYKNSWENARHESGRGPWGIAVGHASNTAAGRFNRAQVQYQAGSATPEWRSGWLQVNGAYANLHFSQDVGEHYWHSGPLANLLSSGGAASAPRINSQLFLVIGASSTPLRTGVSATDATTNTKALQLKSNVGILTEVDTTKIKDWRIASSALHGFGGRLFVGCFDAAGGRLTGSITDTWGTEYYAKFNPQQAISTQFGGGYVMPADNAPDDITVTVRAEVAKIWIGYVGATNPLAIRSFDLCGYPCLTSQESSSLTNKGGIGISNPTADQSDQRLATANPGINGVHGRYQKGEFAWNANAASGQPMGWQCSTTGYLAQAWAASTAYAVPGHCVINDTGKVYALVSAGTSAASGGPTGTGTAISDGTCVWDYVGVQAAFVAGASNP